MTVKTFEKEVYSRAEAHAYEEWWQEFFDRHGEVDRVEFELANTAVVTPHQAEVMDVTFYHVQSEAPGNPEPWGPQELIPGSRLKRDLYEAAGWLEVD